ncbi:hypothetical protein BMF77_01907 [Dolichospermum sp. UHCC 0315A]|jgi:hypothetical protein|uniref:Uncharacterized protein n=1 Tax=Dolichospermum flos-aquae CCAP 1403/13F TaxID=315271 RepID=A0A6H2BV51_DOLFA|nr:MULTISPECIES: hypothetical protein [Dolichospermum]MDB9439155.1 hypothetical protein [Dolichospermum lemmermannii CS-548]QEI41323.1 hypothetical protein BMF77_01907 [Dolichospermum sp. UHCC 0315A]QJB42818.1 hypothetical protein HGD76_02590 [Dolichospermum flos-aquae CCAP 1403/13F]
MSNQVIQSNLLVELSTEEQEFLSGGRKKCYKKCYWVCPKSDDRDRDRDGGRGDNENMSEEE